MMTVMPQRLSPMGSGRHLNCRVCEQQEGQVYIASRGKVKKLCMEANLERKRQ